MTYLTLTQALHNHTRISAISGIDTYLECTSVVAIGVKHRNPAAAIRQTWNQFLQCLFSHFRAFFACVVYVFVTMYFFLYLEHASDFMHCCHAVMGDKACLIVMASMANDSNA